jgi:lysozyme
MRGSLAVIMAFASLIIPIAPSLAQQRDEASWSTLDNDASRGALFEQRVIPAYNAIKSRKRKFASQALPASFRFSEDAEYDFIAKKPRLGVLFGIDISHYTGNKIDFGLLSDQKVSFVYVKATQGSSRKDPKFAEYWKALSNADLHKKLPRGAYHFLSSKEDGRKQCGAFVDYLNLHGGLKPDDLTPVVDLEWDPTNSSSDGWTGLGKEVIERTVLSCLDEIEQRTGRIPMLYTASSWWTSDTIPSTEFAKFGKYPLWIADYNPTRKLNERPKTFPRAKATLWQYTDSSVTSRGYDGRLDASVFYGDLATLHRILMGT